MRKILISLNNIDKYYKDSQKEIILKDSEIITPSVKDLLITKGVNIIYGQNNNNNNHKKSLTGLNDNYELIKQMTYMIINDFNIRNAKEIIEIVSKVMEEIITKEGKK